YCPWRRLSLIRRNDARQHVRRQTPTGHTGPGALCHAPGRRAGARRAPAQLADGSARTREAQPRRPAPPRPRRRTRTRLGTRHRLTPPRSAAGLETAERPAAAPCSGGPFRMSVTGVAPQPPRDTGTPTHTTAAPIRCRTGAAVLASQRVRTPPRGVHATHAPPDSFPRRP